MQYTESSTKQTEHFEWLNAIDFYHAYLDIMTQRFNTLQQMNGNIESSKILAYGDMLDYLKERLHDLKLDVGQHMDEINSGDVADNRLERVSLSVHHLGLKEKFDMFEDMLNGFRSEFNSFYVNNI